MKCDIFISYRRNGGDMTAMYIYQALKERGYDVFYDLEVLRAGKFNDALLEYIQSCRDFVLVLSPSALDRCSDENDWVRKEIAEALRCKKNIVPVMLNGFTFPQTLPEDIDDVRYQNGLSATTEYFQESMSRLCSRYLQSKPLKQRRSASPFLAAAAAALAVLAACAGWYFLAGPGKTPQALPAAVTTPQATEAATATPAPTPVPTQAIPAEKPHLRTDNLPAFFNENGQYHLASVFGNESLKREQITSVTFLDHLSNIGENAWDVSAAQDGSALAWTTPSQGGFDLFIAGNGGVILSCGEDDYSMFAGYHNARAFHFNQCVDTSELNCMQGMFDSCWSVETLDLTGWDTSGVTTMAGLFNDCHQLRQVILPDGFVTSAVQDMFTMFNACGNLEYVNTNGWDLQNVTNMENIFYGCNALPMPDMTGWNVSRVQNKPTLLLDQAQPSISYETNHVLGNTTLTRDQIASVTFLPAEVGAGENHWDASNGTGGITAWVEPNGERYDLYIAGDGGVAFPDSDGDYSIFTGYINAQSINFNGCADFSNVTTVQSLFDSCHSLQSIDLTGMDFSKVRNFSYMFSGCTSLKEAILPGMVTESAENLSLMFAECRHLTHIDFTGWNTSQVGAMQDLFWFCESLTELDVSGWDTSRLEVMCGVFEHCSSLRKLNVSGWDTSRVINMGAAFAYCQSLSELDLSGWDTSYVENMSRLFDGAHNLRYLTLPNGFVGKRVFDTSSMFNTCVMLSEINTTGWDTARVTDMNHMFLECSSLFELDVTGWDVSRVSNMESMFRDCVKLDTLDLSGWTYHPEVNTTDMFTGCSYLNGV